jgi:ribulose-5-phosphate 4-epimerase/fuculose-1-phosphate aldolase
MMQAGEIESALDDLVIANRILANENVVDAYGHVSVRHPRDPRRFFLARSLSPDRVERGDIMEFDLEGNPAGGDARQPTSSASSMRRPTRRVRTCRPWCTRTPRMSCLSASPRRRFAP